MRTRARTFTAAAGVLAASLVLAACGGGSDDDTSSDDGGNTPDASGGELLIWVGTGPGGDATMTSAAAFGEENGVDVKVEVVPATSCRPSS